VTREEFLPGYDKLYEAYPEWRMYQFRTDTWFRLFEQFDKDHFNRNVDFWIATESYHPGMFEFYQLVLGKDLRGKVDDGEKI
jgi:hypothetical protein